MSKGTAKKKGKGGAEKPAVVAAPSRKRAMVRSPMLGLLGLGVLAVIATELLRGSISVLEAATRALVLLVVIGVVERLLLPAARLVVGDPARPESENSE